MNQSELLFLPLGGVGEFGSNVALYGYGDDWIMVDLGMGFGRDTLPGVDLVMPDISWIAQRRDQLRGLYLTHAHEDHLGAVAWLWPQIRCPVYATAFTLAILRNKLAERQLLGRVELIEVAAGQTITDGPFEIEYVTVTHSIPEPNLLRIGTPAGTVIHTGDWKIDDTPLVGEVTDTARIRAIGDAGVLAVIGDSTNAMTEGRSPSEAVIRSSLVAEFGRHTGRIAVTCFSSNIARIESVAVAAQQAGRSFALVGRSLLRMYEAARATGYLRDIPEPVGDRELKSLPPARVALICTGSQGEDRAALARIAANDHPHVKLDRGDTVLFSSRNIPGNERAIFDLQNRLMERGVEIVTHRDPPIHASGHPRRGEIAEMYGWLRPQAVLPVHGEQPHLQAHAQLARSLQIPEVLVPANGQMIRLSPGPVAVVDHVPVGKHAVDGDKLVAIDATSLRERRRLAESGSVLVSLVLDGKGRLLSEPRLTMQGLELPDGKALKRLRGEVRAAVETLSLGDLRDDDAVTEAASRSIRRQLQDLFGKRPMTDVHLHRVR